MSASELNAIRKLFLAQLADPFGHEADCPRISLTLGETDPVAPQVYDGARGNARNRIVARGCQRRVYQFVASSVEPADMRKDNPRFFAYGECEPLSAGRRVRIYASWGPHADCERRSGGGIMRRCWRSVRRFSAAVATGAVVRS